MTWKNLSYWLKGGIIGALIGIIYLVITFILSEYVYVGTNPNNLILGLIALPLFLGYYYCGFRLGGSILPEVLCAKPTIFILLFIVIIIPFFLLGALAGLSIKRKKK